MEFHCIDLSKLHASNSLFLNYAKNFENVSDWYTAPPVDSQGWQRRAEQVSRQAGFPRSSLIEILTRYNSDLGAGEPTFRNLQRLAKDDAVAVVSGQQVSLFGGPAYSVYKAASAVQFAAQLRAQGTPAVPVFWLAANDSDFEEIRTAHFLNKKGEELALRLSDSRQDLNQMTGSISLRDVDALSAGLADSFQELDFGQQTLASLAAAYDKDSTLGRAFGVWLSSLFREHGLIILDPTLPSINSRLAGFYSTCVSRRKEIVNSLVDRSQTIRNAGFAPQVSLDESEGLLFLVDGQRRTKLKFQNGRYQAKGIVDTRMSETELLQLAGSQPDRLSPGVLVRPLLQDFLLPTLAYIGGPAEVAYFAQLHAIGRFWDRDLLILPRSSLTLVDRKSQRLLRKYDLSVEDVLLGSLQSLGERIVRTSEAAGLLVELETLQEGLRDRLTALEARLKGIDASVAGMLPGVREKVSYQLGKLSARFVQNQRQRQPSLEHHLQHLRSRLAPGGAPQERVLSFSQFEAEEGNTLLERLLPHLSPSSLCHKVCYL